MKKLLYLLTALLFSVMSFAQTTESVTLNSGEHDGTNITWTIAQGNITISQLKAASSTAVSTSYVAAPRMYKGHILQFAAAEGYGITNISITYDGSYYGTGLYAGTAISDNVVTANTTDLTATYATASNGTHTIATVSAEGASLIALQIPSSAASGYKQLRPTEISITYVKAATSEPTISCGDVNFGTVNSAVINSKEVEVIGENLGTEITASLESGTAFSINGTLTATGGTLTLTVTATTDGTYTDKLTLTSGTTSKEVEVSATVVVCEGEGTEEKPYTVNDVIKLANPAISAWVEGYIVGVMKNNELSTDDLSVNSNLALGATADATENIVPVELKNGSVLRTELNLVDNPGNLGKKVAVYGELVPYFNIAGIKNTSIYKWVAAEGAPEAPTFTPAAGTYFAAQNVTISAEEGATIYYTIDGTDPTTESPVYSTPIEIAETKTLKAIAVKDEKVSPIASAKYTINLPLTTMDQIFAKATAVGNTATSVQVVMNNWVITGVKGSNAYLTDGTKGLIIYTTSHGFEVGDVLSGTVECKVQLYNGSSELKELTSATTGLTVTKGGTVDPVVLDAAGIAALGGVNTGAVIKINGICASDNVVGDVKLYNTLFDFETLTVGQEYNVTGVYLQFDATKEILPRSEADIEKVEGLPTATISIADITMEVDQEKTIEATITPDAAQSTVQYAITSGNEYITLSGTTITAVAVGTATITATIAEKADEYKGATKEFTVTVKPQNIAELPFEFTGGKDDIENTLGMSQEGLGSYTTAGVTTKLKFDGTGDWVIIHFNGQAEKLAYDIKGNSFSNGTFTVQQSADGSAYTDVVTYTELGDAATTKEHELAAESRYVKFIYTEKSSGNVGLGNIKITEPDNRADAGLAWNPTSVTLTQGEAFTAPTLINPHLVADITYKSSNEDVATVSAEGVIALVDDAVGTVTITASFLGDATYKPATATCTIMVNEDCEGSDDFETATATNASSYNTRTTEAGWEATNAAKITIEGELGTYLAINGKISAVGTITSPVLNGGIGSIKIRYANTFSESNGVSFRLDIKQDDAVVKTYTITKANDAVVKGTVYTELIENINVEGDFQMVFTNLSPSNDTGNKDRVSIGRLCWTGYEETPQEPEIVTLTYNLTNDAINERMGGRRYVTAEDETLGNVQIIIPDFSAETTEYTGAFLIVGSETLNATATYAADAENNLEVYTATATSEDGATIYNVTMNVTVPATQEYTFLATNGAEYVTEDWGEEGEPFIVYMISGEGYLNDEPVAFEMMVDQMGNLEATINDVYVVGTATSLVEEEGTIWLQGTANDEGGNTYNIEMYVAQAVEEVEIVITAEVDVTLDKLTLEVMGNMAMVTAGEEDLSFWLTLLETENYYGTYSADMFNNIWYGEESLQPYGDGVYDQNGLVVSFISEPDADGNATKYNFTLKPETYTRTVTEDYYGTICLPYGSNNYTGAEFYELVQAKADGVVLASVETLEAGVPYIFKATATELAVYSDGTTAATPGNHNGLHGTFTDNTEVAVGNYILKDNAICEVAATCYVDKNRAYVVMSEVPTEPVQQMPGRRYIGMDVHGENGTTGLDNIMTTDAPAKVIVNGQLIIIRDGVKYNVQGQKL